MVLGVAREGQATPVMPRPPERERERVGNVRLCQGYDTLLLLAFFEDCHIANLSQLAPLARGWQSPPRLASHRPCLRHAMTKWPHHPNLRKKPHAPSKGRGPVQRAIRRAFLASGAGVLTSTEVYDWAHGRRRFGRRKSM